MYSLLHSITVGACVALTVSVVIPETALRAQGTQDTTHKMTMPMNMPMGKKPAPKKPAKASAAKSTTAKKAPAKSNTAKKTTGQKTTGQKTTVRKSSAAKATSKSPSATDDQTQMPAGMQMPSGKSTMADSMQPKRADTSQTKMGGMNMQPTHTSPDSAHAQPPRMQMVTPAGVPMERMGSGTTWIPDAVSLPSRNRMAGRWMLMTHGFVFVQYDKQGGERGDNQFGSLNWGMWMATRNLLGGRFQARTMLSLDPLTVTNRGYPLLLQSGESYKGEPLHDRQHPHDFFMELGALYQRDLTKGLAWSIYAAPSGEPALGPVAFMHRPSAMDNLAAPLTHHWQDATHVSFGVITAGLFAHSWQLEGSVFNGREPDEKRWDFDPIKLDSYSGRLTINPSAHWSLVAGYGYLKSPEALNPDEPTRRMTASVLNGWRLGSDGQFSSTFSWGANKRGSAGASWSNGYLTEAEAILDRGNTLFGRAELVEKTAEDLVVDRPTTLRNGTVLPALPADKRFNVGALQLGYIREIAKTHWATIGLGAAGTINFVPRSLEPYYGSKNPAGLFLFLRLRPFHRTSPTMQMDGMAGTQMKQH